MNLLDEIKDFLNNEDLASIFRVKGYSVSFEKGWFKLLNINTMEVEELNIFNDPSNKNRVRFKGEKFAFSINHDEERKVYLDHLLIGDIEKKEFDFSMRHTINTSKEKFIIKFTNDKNEKIMFEINPSFLIMLKKDKSTNNQQRFYVYENEYQIANLPTSDKDYAESLWKEIINLGKQYPNLIDYIIKRIPFFNKCITSILNSKNDFVKEYTINRKPHTLNLEEKEEISSSANRDKFKIIDGNNQNEHTKIYRMKNNQ